MDLLQQCAFAFKQLLSIEYHYTIGQPHYALLKKEKINTHTEECIIQDTLYHLQHHLKSSSITRHAASRLK